MDKSQMIRLIDVLFIGPLLIYAASQPKLSPEVRLTIGVIGALTITYNWQNYQANVKLP
jgi:hypothetical protein